MAIREKIRWFLWLSILAAAFGCATSEEVADVTWDVPWDAPDVGDDGAIPEVRPPVSCTVDSECDDGIDCTIDTCNPATGFCEHDPQAVRCDDGNPCNGAEACSPTEGCRPGAPVECDDGIDCTVDACNPLTVECTSRPDHGRCTAPQICDPTWTSDPSGCILPPSCETDGECDDGDACNGRETCGPDRRCRPGTPVSCDDGRDCTVDRCRPADGGCDHVGPDVDGDTYGDAACTGNDCNDRDRLVHPGATELCNGADDNCDTRVDESAVCPPLPNASSVACVAATCVPTCATGWGNCNGNPSDGCERRLDTLTDCGGCGIPCNLPRAAESCASGSCAITSCDGGYGDCNHVASDGCEQSLTTTAHCGGCGVSCNPPHTTGASCSTGSCTFSGCIGGYGDCNTSRTDGCETNLNTSTSCGASCTSRTNCTTLPHVGTTSCSSGTCVISSCARAYAECDNVVSNGCERLLDDNVGSCSGAISLGALSGDTGSPTITRNSYGEIWYNVRVTEDSGAGIALTVRIHLQSPPGVDYDLYVHGGGSCGTCVQSRTSGGAGAADYVNVGWTDFPVRSDSRDIYIEVRFSGGSTTDCGAWTLTITGNPGTGVDCT